MLAAISLIFPYFFGLGCLLFPALGRMKEEIPHVSDSKRLQLLANVFVLGILLNHAMALTLIGLKQSLLAGGALSIVGLGYYVICRIKGHQRLISPAWVALCTVVGVASLFSVLVDPLSGWDARSIWFFHAKMIYYNGSVTAGGDWSLPSVAFSHTDYPELIPILAGEIAFLAGYWNEYLPKLSLAVLLVPALIALISILRERWWQIVFISMPLLFTLPWLKNGYMDGYLALYAGLATFHWGRWLDRCEELDLITAILFMGVVVSLKNEGALYCLVVALLLPSFVVLKRVRGDGLHRAIFPKSALPVSLVSCSGFVLWERVKTVHCLQNDLHLGLVSLGRITERLKDGALWVILEHLYVIDNVSLTLGILQLSLVVTLWVGKRPTAGGCFCTMAGFLYFSGIVIVYLATPCDLVGFHLPTGDRTMLPVHLMLLTASFSICCNKAKQAQHFS